MYSQVTDELVWLPITNKEVLGQPHPKFNCSRASMVFQQPKIKTQCANVCVDKECAFGSYKSPGCTSKPNSALLELLNSYAPNHQPSPQLSPYHRYDLNSNPSQVSSANLPSPALRPLAPRRESFLNEFMHSVARKISYENNSISPISTTSPADKLIINEEHQRTSSNVINPNDLNKLRLGTQPLCANSAKIPKIVINKECGRLEGSVKASKDTSTLVKYGRVRKILGQGSGGTVRLSQLPNGQLYAIKEFRKKRDTETYREYQKKITSEFCIASSLIHHTMIRTFDLVNETNHTYEVMEFVPHQFYQLAQAGVMTISEIDCYLVQMLQGVEYLQSMGIVHRDIKPENYVVNDFGVLKLIDFGCSFVYRTPFESKSNFITINGVAGSEPYMAPEIFTEDFYDPRPTDLWAVGVVYFALNTQQLPWQAARQNNAHYSRFISTEFYKSKTFDSMPSKKTGCLIRGLLNPNPSKRMTVELALKECSARRISCCTSTHNYSDHFHHLTQDL